MHNSTFITWNGKNYLIESRIDYDRKNLLGLYLTSFENGKLSQRFLYERVRKDEGKAVTIKNSFLLDESYAILKQSLDQFVYTDYRREDESPYANCGTAETKTEETPKVEFFTSDLNNDGVKDSYSKCFFEPSSWGARLELRTDFDENDELQTIVDDIIYGDDYPPVSLWADETEFGNVVYVLYEENTFDYHICGFLIEDDHYKKLIQNDYHYELDVVEQEE